MINKRLMRLLGTTKKYIGRAVLWNWLSMLCNVGVVFLLADILRGIRNESREWTSFLVHFLLIAALVIFRHLCQRKSADSAYRTSADVKQTLREKLYSKLLSVGNAYQDSMSTSEVLQVSMEGVEQLEVYFSKYIPQLFYSVLAPATLFAVLLPVDWKVAAALFICVPLIPVSIVAVQKLAKKLLAKYWGRYTSLGDSFLENLQGLTTLKIYQADEKKQAEMDKEAEQFRKITMRVLIMQLNSISVMDLVAMGGAALGIVLGLFEFQAARIGLEELFIIILLSAEFFIPMRMLGSFFHIAMNGLAASDKIFKLLDLEEETGRNQLLKKMGQVSFQGVCFAYNDSEEILQDIRMEISPCGFIALVGVSGCGKSTIAGILTGKNKNYRGSIQIAGQELRGIAPESLLEQVTLVSHNSSLFAGTVEENLRMARPNATPDEMLHALKKVQLYEFLMQQEGLNTRIEEQGANLSGGQRQRLALARALLRDSQFYIFDEATSNIDAESEETIMHVIHGMKLEKTILLISHRLANVVPADQIYMLEHGQVAEQGSHGELMALQGAYARLFESQQRLENAREEAVSYA